LVEFVDIGCKRRHPCLERLLNGLSISSHQSVLFWKRPVGPHRSVLAGSKTAEFGKEPLAEFG
jgi:hypothetical protein